MKPKPMTRNQWLLVAGILILTFLHRWHGLGAYPVPHQTEDEIHFVWVGVSLLEHGRAVSWSWLPGYKESGAELGLVKVGGTYYNIVRPCLDHPPLFGLAAGAFARLARAVQPAELSLRIDGVDVPTVNIARARLFTLLLFAATFLLLFTLAREAFSFQTACLTVLFYGFIAHVVCHNRLLVSENLTTPLFLAGLCVTQRYLAGRCSRRTFGTLAVFTTAAALLCKVVAVAQAGAVVFLLLMAGRRREILFPVLGALLGVALYLFYGWWQGWEVFRAILGAQSARFYGFDVPVKFLLHPRLVHDEGFSYLLLLAWLALFGQVLHARRSAIFGAALAYLLIFIFFASSPATYGWHLLPFYPFLCMALAATICRLYRRASTPQFLGITVLLLPQVFHVMFVNNSGHALLFRYSYLLALCALLVFSFAGQRSRQRAVRYSLILLTAVLLLDEFWPVWWGLHI